jgi:hypothetical protein
MKLWTLLTVIAATILFVVALSNTVYDATSPSWLSWHVLLRKFYSVIAFAVVGYFLRGALKEHDRPDAIGTCVLGVTAYSAAIEIGQAAVGSHEGLLWNVVDVACGALGGALACADVIVRRLAATRAI